MELDSKTLNELWRPNSFMYAVIISKFLISVQYL